MLLTFLNICHVDNLGEWRASRPLVHHLNQAKVKLFFEFLFRCNEATFGLDSGYRSSNRKYALFSLDIRKQTRLL